MYFRRNYSLITFFNAYRSYFLLFIKLYIKMTLLLHDKFSFEINLLSIIYLIIVSKRQNWIDHLIFFIGCFSVGLYFEDLNQLNRVIIKFNSTYLCICPLFVCIFACFNLSIYKSFHLIQCYWEFYDKNKIFFLAHPLLNRSKRNPFLNLNR